MEELRLKMYWLPFDVGRGKGGLPLGDGGVGLYMT